MKRCPECLRDYYDDSLAYCLDDGSVLVDGPSARRSSSVDAPTAVLHKSAPATVYDTPMDRSANGGSAVTPNSIVVLPFANLSRDDDADYLSDGLAEELLNMLAKIDGLRVAGRTSSFSFKGKQTTFKEIGRLLNVSSVLEGSVRMAGTRVRIAVRLINISDGFQIWTETYDRTMDDIFEIQDDIARSVAGELRSRLGKTSLASLSGEVADAAKGRTQDPEAQRLVLLGRHLSLRRTEADMSAAIKYLEEAVSLDPESAICWLELGNARFANSPHNWGEPLSMLHQARNAAEKALSLDPDLAAAHALLGRIQMLEFDFRGAEGSLRRAEELAPEDPFVLAVIGIFMMQTGRFDLSIKIARRGLTLDPLNITMIATLGYVSFRTGMLDEAETAFRRALEITPYKPGTPAYLALILSAKGREEEALRWAHSETDEPWRLWAIAIVENAAGRHTQAHASLSELIEKYSSHLAFQIAEAYATFGETEEAFKWLETAFGVRDPGLAQLKWSTSLIPLHADPRWAALLKRVGFPDE